MNDETSAGPDTSPPGGSGSKLVGLLQRLGPGFIYVLTTLGAGDLVSNAAAGSGYGYALIWTVALSVVLRYVWVDVSAKYVLVTGESLAQGYARMGRWVVWILLIATMGIGHLSVMYSMVMSGDILDVLIPLPIPWSAQVWSLFFSMLAFVMAYWGGYGVIETFCKILVAVMGGALVVVAVMSKPDMMEVLKGAVIPSIPGTQGLYSALLIIMALVGTMAGSLTNLTYAYYIHAKGWRDASHLRAQRFDLIFGVACLFFMGALLQIAAAATLNPLGVELEDANDLVRIFSEVQGTIGLVIFSLGLWGAAFSTLLGTMVGYGLVAADLARFVRKKQSVASDEQRSSRRDPFYRGCLVFWLFSPLYILFTDVSPIWLVLIANSLFIVMIPVLTPILLILTNRRSLMGKYTNNWFTNTILVMLVAVAFYVGGSNAWEAFKGWM